MAFRRASRRTASDAMAQRVTARRAPGRGGPSAVIAPLDASVGPRDRRRAGSPRTRRSGWGAVVAGLVACAGCAPSPGAPSPGAPSGAPGGPSSGASGGPSSGAASWGAAGAASGPAASGPGGDTGPAASLGAGAPGPRGARDERAARPDLAPGTSTKEDPRAALAPLEGEAFVDLPLSWGEPALVSVPLGARGPEPVIVATHGAGGRAEYHCGLWRRIVGAAGFVVCPRGYPMNRRDPETGYFYDGHPALGREIEAALAALTARFGAHVDPSAPIFAGYSQGASMGALVLPHHPAGFARAVLWEGGVGQHQEWNVAVAERFRAQGALRVVLACGRPKCQEPAQRTAGYLRRAAIEARLVYVPGAGHTSTGRLADEVAAAFGWLVGDDPRWIR